MIKKTSNYISQDQHTDRFVIRFQSQLDQRITLESKIVEKNFRENYGLFDGEPNELQEDFDRWLFDAKAKIVKACLAAHQEAIKKINEDYQRELKYRKADKYLLYEDPKWMMKDEVIVNNLVRFRFTIPILNYLWNINRYTRGEALKEMFDQTRKVAGQVKHKTDNGKLYRYATFVSNDAFYKKMASKIGCSKNYIQKYFIELMDIGILKKLGNVGRDGTLYADGYYIPYGDNQYRKEVFLRNESKFREGLRNFYPLRIRASKKK